MKAATIKEAHTLIQKDAPNANTLIAICETNDNISVSFLGEPSKIGKALYAVMHDDRQPEMAAQTYLMVKDIVYNLLREKTDYSKDMFEMAFQTADEEAYTYQPNTVPLPFTGEA